MRAYQDLDAFKACHELTLAIHRLLERLRERDPELAGELWQAALISGSRIVRGTVFPNKRSFTFCLNRSIGALEEMGYHLTLADILGLLDADSLNEVENLRARAHLFVTLLLESVLESPDKG